MAQINIFAIEEEGKLQLETNASGLVFLADAGTGNGLIFGNFVTQKLNARSETFCPKRDPFRLQSLAILVN